jgi:spermidine/putrescine transport system ATP-binding protein
MIGQGVELDAVSMRFGSFLAVQPTTLSIEPAEFFSILGPSGCGKTTLLRLISGFESPSSGAIRIGGRDMAGIGPNGRPTALIFQNLALFPLISVRENVAFGLEARGVSKPVRNARADELLALVALSGEGDKLPSALSGGQRQRVAIARALAVEPGVMLLDEPLSALDLKLRQLMRAELRAIQKRTGVTFIYITHDQGEALAMSDRVAVMSRGRIEQIASPASIYADPSSLFVATFVGEQNKFSGKVMAVRDDFAEIETVQGHFVGRLKSPLAPGDPAWICVRPERLDVEAGADSDANRLAGRVLSNTIEGPTIVTEVGAGNGVVILHQRNSGHFPKIGSEISLSFLSEDALVFAQAEAKP